MNIINNLIVLVFLVIMGHLLTSCGTTNEMVTIVQEHKTIEGCTITKGEYDMTIQCGDTIESFTLPINGKDGKDGEGCSVISNPQGALITCGENSVLIHNGINGKDGRDGRDNVLEVVRPCPYSQEILLRLDDGTIIAFYQGKQGFLTVLTDGTYITTDGKNCKFTIYQGEIL